MTSQHLINLLEQEFKAGTAFVRVHAAEMLWEHGYGFKVAPVLQADVESPTPGYRVGVWRVLARIAPGAEERNRFIERIRRTAFDAEAPDRLVAAESLAKLGVADRTDRLPLEQWLGKADDASGAFPLWLLLLSSNPQERTGDEARLARYLESADAIARLRSSYALGRLASPSAESIEAVRHRLGSEPAESEARVYMVGAAFLHTPRGSTAALKNELSHFLQSPKANEVFEVATVISLRGVEGDAALITPALEHPEPDARIGAAGALLRLLK